MRILLFIPLLFILLTSCENESVYFEAIQPADLPDEKGFSKKYQGSYFDQQDSAILSITGDKVVKSFFAKVRFHKDDLDSFYLPLRNDNSALMREFAKIGMKAQVVGDSIFGDWTIRDTLFSISDDQVLRQYKGHYFLNYKEGENRWTLKRLSLDKKLLQISVISPYDSILKFKAITNYKEIRDTAGKLVNYSLKPSKNEMKRLIREDAFTEREVWKKIK